MKVSNFLVLCVSFLLLFTAASCTQRAYTVHDFEVATYSHKRVAVLPFEIVYTGVKPKRITHEDLEKILLAESEIFQNNFYNQILRSSGLSDRMNLMIDMQAHSTTAGILAENGISIKDSWNMRSGELAELLGVDAVVRGRVEQDMLMSDWASFGVDIGVAILTSLGGGTFGFFPSTTNKTIFSSYQLINAEDERLLWSISYNCAADWSQTTDQVINTVNRRAARRFPYRNQP